MALGVLEFPEKMHLESKNSKENQCLAFSVLPQKSGSLALYSSWLKQSQAYSESCGRDKDPTSWHEPGQKTWSQYFKTLRDCPVPSSLTAVCKIHSFTCRLPKCLTEFDTGLRPKVHRIMMWLVHGESFVVENTLSNTSLHHSVILSSRGYDFLSTGLL